MEKYSKTFILDEADLRQAIGQWLYDTGKLAEEEITGYMHLLLGEDTITAVVVPMENDENTFRI